MWLACALVLIGLALHFAGCYPATHLDSGASTVDKVGIASEWRHQNEPAHCEMHSADYLAALDRADRAVCGEHHLATDLSAPIHAVRNPWVPQADPTLTSHNGGGRSLLLALSVSRT